MELKINLDMIKNHFGYNDMYVLVNDIMSCLCEFSKNNQLELKGYYSFSINQLKSFKLIISEIDSKIEFNKKFIKKVNYESGYIITQIGIVHEIYKTFEVLKNENISLRERVYNVENKMKQLELHGRGSKSSAQSAEITKLLNKEKEYKRIMEKLNIEIDITKKECDNKIDLMNEELANYDMCRLRIKDLEKKVERWQNKIKPILSNPTSNEIFIKNNGNLKEIFNDLTIKTIKSYLIDNEKDDYIMDKYGIFIKKINKLKGKLIFANKKFIEDKISLENDILLNETIINNKSLYNKDIVLFKKTIPKEFLNKIINDNHDITGLSDNEENNLNINNYKKLLIVSEYLCDFGLRKITLWLRAEIARKIFNFNKFNNTIERYYYTYVTHDYDISLSDYMNVKNKNKEFIVSTKKLMKSINTGLGYQLIRQCHNHEFFNCVDDLSEINLQIPENLVDYISEKVKIGRKINYELKLDEGKQKSLRQDIKELENLYKLKQQEEDNKYINHKLILDNNLQEIINKIEENQKFNKLAEESLVKMREERRIITEKDEEKRKATKSIESDIERFFW